MRILQVNKFFYPKGGAETYFLALIELLKKNGHEVFAFSQKNEKNLPSGQAEFFISNINLEKFHFKNIFKIGRIFWSFEAAGKIRKLIKKTKPQIAHLHNIYHQISPSILPVLKKAGIPIVMTVHDFKLIKPDYTLRANHQKIRHKNSFLADWLIKLEFYFHKTTRIYKKYVDVFIAPSNFVKNQLVKNGFDPNKLFVLPHFVDLADLESNEKSDDENYVLFFGRLDESKGADALIKSFKNLDGNVKLKIAGDGPQKAELKKIVRDLALEDKIDFLGVQSKNDLKKVIAHSLFTVFPSRVHETFGLGILESYAQGKPVIANRVGAFPEIIKHNETGILVKADDQLQLKQAIEYLINKPDNIVRMGKNAQAFAQEFSSQIHYDKLMEIYRKALLPAENKKH